MRPDAQPYLTEQAAETCRPRWFASLSTRLLFSCVATLAVSLASVSFVLLYVFTHYPNQTLGRHSEFKSAIKLAQAVHFDGTGRPASVTLPPEMAILFTAFAKDTGYRIVDAQGHTVLASQSEAPFAAPGTAFAAPPERLSLTRAGGVFHVTSEPLAAPAQGGRYYAQISTSESFEAMEVHNKLASVPAVVKITLALAVLMFALTLRLTLRSMFRPLHEISHAAAQISPRNLAARLSTRRVPTELQPLIEAFNAALARLEQGYLAQQSFLAAAAHELQTPLTLIRGQVEIEAHMDGKHRVLQDIDLMSRQVRQLLHLTELSETQNYCFADTDVAAVMDDVVQYLQRRAAAQGVGVGMQVLAPGLSVRADKSALFILLKNLLENALGVAPAGSTVSLTAGRDFISVRDAGPGIDPAFMPFIYDRFWRAPGAQYEGTGLGLAICKEIATAHDWRLSAQNQTPGACLRIDFAAAPGLLATFG